MGQLAKSLRKSGGLEDVKNNLKGIAGMLEDSRKKEEQKQFISTIVNLYDKWKQGQEMAKMKTNLKEGGNVNNVLSPENFVGMTGKKPTGLNLNVNVPENIQTDLTKNPMPPEIQTRDVSPKERYEKSQENLYSFLESVAPLVMNPNIDEGSISRANVLTNLAQTQSEKLKPKEPTYFNLGANQERYSQDQETGEVKKIASNIKPGDKKNIYERVETFKVKGKPVKMGLRRDTGEWEEIGEAYYKPNVTNINLPEEKGLKDSTAKLIADLKNFKPYTVDEDGKQVPMDAKDIKYAKDTALENIKLQLLSNPRAYEFVTNIETLWKEGDPTGARQYLSPKELYREALKHAESGNLEEDVQDQIATYLRYYSNDIYKGLTTQPEGK